MPWEDSKKFWSETWRTVVLGAVGGFIALWYVAPTQKSIENSVGYKAALDTKKLEMRAKVVDDFLLAAHQYVANGYDVCLGPSPSQSEEQAKEERKKWKALKELFESKLVDDLGSARRRMSLYFVQDLASLDQNVGSAADDLHTKCKVSPAMPGWKQDWHRLDTAVDELSIAALKRLNLYSFESQ